MTRKINRIFSPLSLPIIFFLTAICIGAILLHSSFSYQGQPISWLDAFFTATSATCVTGLTVVDTGSAFSPAGQSIILFLIQLGGLGIMTFTSLAFYLLKRRVSLTDRIAVGQSLLHDSSFHLGNFLIHLVAVVFAIELSGTLLLVWADSSNFSYYSALFHAISAFCNAGFSLYSDNLVFFKGNLAVNVIIMVLIILGGLGFAVMIEGNSYLLSFFRTGKKIKKISWHSMIVLQTSFFLIIVGWVYIYFAEFINFQRSLPFHEGILSALFQSVTCRTAGFNTLDIGALTNASLIFMMILMLIGGAPGSCAGGIKVTTFRVLWAFIRAQIKGRHQVVIGKFGVDKESINRSLTLMFFAVVLIFVCVVLLDFTEGGDVPHTQVHGQFLEILFEVVSAFGTVGLSTGLTPKLSPFGKTIIILLMFVGRLGPLVLLASIQSIRTKILYSLPEEKLSIG